jgi:hypothetical protein
MKTLTGAHQVRELHVTVNISYVWNYVAKLYTTTAKIILKHLNPNIRGFRQGEALHRKYKRLKLGGGKACDRSAYSSFGVSKLVKA